MRRVGAVAGIAAAIALIVVGGPRLLRSLPDDEVPISPGPTATVPPVDIDGTWTTTVEPGQVRATLTDAGLGEWADGLISGEGTGLGPRTPGYPQDLTLTLADGDYELTNVTGDVLDEARTRSRASSSSSRRTGPTASRSTTSLSTATRCRCRSSRTRRSRSRPT